MGPGSVYIGVPGMDAACRGLASHPGLTTRYGERVWDLWLCAAVHLHFLAIACTTRYPSRSSLTCTHAGDACAARQQHGAVAPAERGWQARLLG